MVDYIEKFKFIDQGGIGSASPEIGEFVTTKIEVKFNGLHSDFIDFSKKYYDLYIGNADAKLNKDGDIFFSFYPIEDSFEFDNPFEDELFLFAESQEKTNGEIKYLSFYLSIGKSMTKGVYVSLYNESEPLKYSFCSPSFTEFMRVAIEDKGRFYSNVYTENLL